MAATKTRNVSRGITLNTTGLNEVMAALESISGSKVLEEAQEKALRAGIDVIADNMRDQLNKLHTTEENYRTDRRYATKREKNLLLRELGVTPTRSYQGDMNVKVGFDGYGYPTRKYPDGVPTQLVANSINRGTSFLIPQPFITRTMNAGKRKALEEIEKVFNEYLQNAFNAKVGSVA